MSGVQKIKTVVLCTVDTLRRDKMGFYGCPFNTSPNLDELAAKSIIYDNAWAVGNKTDPAFTSMETGLLPEQHGIIHHGGEIKEDELSNVYELPTLAIELQKQGWYTIGMDWLGRWHRRGFNYYMGYTKEKKKKMRVIEKIRDLFGIQPGSWAQNILEKTPLYNFMLRQLFTNQDPPYKRAEPLVKEIPKYNKSKKTFIFLHFWDCHIPYWPPKEFIKNDVIDDRPLSEIRKTIKAPLRRFFFDCMMFDKKTVGDCINAYHGTIRYVDYWIGEFVKTLDMDSTLFYFTADHGESLTENEIYFTHDGFADCVLRIPMFMYYPGCSSERTQAKTDLSHIKQRIYEKSNI